jgi:hypothetical protein
MTDQAQRKPDIDWSEFTIEQLCAWQAAKTLAFFYRLDARLR